MSELIVRSNCLSKMCRLCLAADPPALFDIFSFSNELNSKLSDAIMKCAPVQIGIEDKLPNVICNTCYQKLIAISEFQKMIISSEGTLLLYLERSENRDFRNNDVLKSPLDIKTEPLDITFKCEDDTDDSSEQLKYNDIGDSKTRLYNLMNNKDIETPIYTNSVPLDTEKDCLPSNNQNYFPNKNSSFCMTVTVDRGDFNTEGSINEYTDGDNVDTNETKVCLQSTLDVNLKKSDPSDLTQSVSMSDVVNEFRLSGSEINENIDTADQYSHHRNIFCTEHKIKANAGFESQHQCNVCNKVFSQLSHLIEHKRIHIGEKPYRCDLCDKSFSKSNHLTAHKRTHTGEKPYKCDFCDTSFSTSSNLITHKRIHTGVKPYKCDLCDTSFSTSSSLITHKRIHTGVKPYKCDLCEISFSTSSSLITHKRIHTGIKPYKCDLCDTSFSTSSSLITHKRIHTGIKPYKCDLCDTSFSTSSKLFTHQRIHTGLKPYKCDLCDKSFSRLDALICHKRTHTGEKPYKCDFCNKSFSTSSHLIRHKRSHTGEKPYRCDTCNKMFSDSSLLTKHKCIHAKEKLMI